jgi:hypothetical protein
MDAAGTKATPLEIAGLIKPTFSIWRSCRPPSGGTVEGFVIHGEPAQPTKDDLAGMSSFFGQRNHRRGGEFGAAVDVAGA